LFLGGAVMVALLFAVLAGFALWLRAGRNLPKQEWERYFGPNIPQQPSCSAFGLASNWRTPDP